jgi:NADH-quinone oxidoreductase subunit M
MLVKMGTYAFFLAFYVIAGTKVFLSLGSGLFSFHSVLSMLAAVTILVPTFMAIKQNDAKRLLAWSTVGQAGYIILGLVYGTNLALVGGLFHFFNHALFKALLFLAIGAVEYRTRTRDLNSLGGLAVRMPVVFYSALVGICALVGVPLTNGFVSKWLIYKSLILEGSPFLALFALAGTWGAILYSYKLIHHVFLGQLSARHSEVEPAPWSMRLPLVILSAGVILFGIVPGLPLRVLNAVSAASGYASLEIGLSGVASDSGALSIVNIFTAVVVAGLVVWMVFRLGRPSVRVAQDDSYAAGAYVPRDRYHYTVGFYRPLLRMIGPCLRDVVDEFYGLLAAGTGRLSAGVRRIYPGDLGYYLTYIIVFAAFLVFVQIRWGPW